MPEYPIVIICYALGFLVLNPVVERRVPNKWDVAGVLLACVMYLFVRTYILTG